MAVEPTRKEAAENITAAEDDLAAQRARLAQLLGGPWPATGSAFAPNCTSA